MKNILIMLIVLTITSACASGGQRYYYLSNLNNLSIDQTKQQVMRVFPGENTRFGMRPMLIRAAQRSNGKLVEVGEMRMLDKASRRTTIVWFLFEDNTLQQWGRPEDWRSVSARYEIDYNPSIGVSF